MSRWIVKALGLLFLFQGAPAEFNERDFARSRRIEIRDPKAPASYLLVNLDAAVYAGAQEDLDDLRVVTDDGKQVPSQVIVARDETREESRSTRLLDRMLSPERDTLFTLDLGADAPQHNRLLIETESRNFSRRVTVETSDDNRTWAVARGDGYIFDFSRDTSARFLTIDYPTSTRRYVRVRIWNEGEKPIEVEGAEVSFLIDREARLEQWPAKLENLGRESNRKTSLLRLDLGTPKLPHSRIEIETGASNFHRHVEIEGSRDAERWARVGEGEIFSVALERINRRHLVIDYPETRYRFLRLRIFDYDDQPLEISEARVYGRARRLLFRREPGESYRLLYGNARAAAPRYDLERLTPYLDLAALETASLSEEREVEAAAEAGGRPWYERQPYWLWLTMGAAGLLLGALIYRLAKMTGNGEQ